MDGFWQRLGMPQVQLPIFPRGVTPITPEVAFQCEEGKVYYFNGHLPVFVHHKEDLARRHLRPARRRGNIVGWGAAALGEAASLNRVLENQKNAIRPRLSSAASLRDFCL